MIITTCAACAAPLAHNAPRCVRCQTRYCNKTCQHDHWRRGHKQMCKKIHRGGNAEQYHADKKYKEAVAEAVEACADDVKGQTCYICTQALHWKTKEGLVRMCACRGTAGFAHVSCLAEQAKILVAEAEENNLGEKAWNKRWPRWYSCSLCEQEYHGVVAHALGWACWKTYLGRPERDSVWCDAMLIVGTGVCKADRFEEGRAILEAALYRTRCRTDVTGLRLDLKVLKVQGLIATCLNEHGRYEEALILWRVIYAKYDSIKPDAVLTCGAAANLAEALSYYGLRDEAISFLRNKLPVARSVLGRDHVHVWQMTERLASNLFLAADEAGMTREALDECDASWTDLFKAYRQVLGTAHPDTQRIQRKLEIIAEMRASKSPDWDAFISRHRREA